MKPALAFAGGGVLGAAIAIGIVLLGDRGYKPKFKKLEKDYETLATKIDNDATALAESRTETSKLRDEVKNLENALSVARDANAAEIAKRDEAKERKSGETPFEGLGELFAKMGSAASKFESKKLREVLGLSGAQLGQFELLLEQSGDARKAAFAATMSGKATLEQFARIEGATPELDRFAETLSPDQQQAYAEYKHQQNQDRIERKANEELMWLQTVAKLDETQKDQAFEIFADQASRERPESLLDMSGGEEFGTYVDEAMDERRGRLGKILDEDQMTAYTEQADLWANMAKAMAAGAATEGNE